MKLLFCGRRNGGKRSSGYRFYHSARPVESWFRDEVTLISIKRKYNLNETPWNSAYTRKPTANKNARELFFEQHIRLDVPRTMPVGVEFPLPIPLGESSARQPIKSVQAHLIVTHFRMTF